MKTGASLLAVAVLGALSGTAVAGDYEDGLAAFDAAKHGLAYDRWLACARDGAARCQYAVGVLLDEGLGVGQDSADAVTWLERAAQQGLPDAAMQLGFVFATGREGVAQDPVLAWAWFSRAVSLGVPQAARNRDRVESLLTEEELARARQAADDLSIQYHLQKK